METSREIIKRYTDKIREKSSFERELYDKYDVKRGLRDINGKGVITGLTNISLIQSSKEVDGKTVPCDGKLLYRGYDVKDLLRGLRADRRLGAEETAYLLLFGDLPTKEELDYFKEILVKVRHLPTNFTRDVIMKAPSSDIMNSLTKSVLTLSSYDRNLTDLSLENVLRQCLTLISVFPMLAVYGYHAYNHYSCDQSMYIHRPDPNLSMAENILRILRPDMKFTKIEAGVLDAALILHMEHGGGNNSTFTSRVVTSSGSDTYAVMAAALSSLKGPRHGGANLKVVDMMEDIKDHLKDYEDEDELRAYLTKILQGQAFDHKGLIYGMGHAVYSISDPRAVSFKAFVQNLAEEKGLQEEFELYDRIERIAPQVIAGGRNIYKGVSANVDFYSGFVYKMLDIPVELFTPIFAIARVVGWSAHRLEELVTMDKIIRPAYKSTVEERVYTSLRDRSVHKLNGSRWDAPRLEKRDENWTGLKD